MGAVYAMPMMDFIIHVRKNPDKYLNHMKNNTKCKQYMVGYSAMIESAIRNNDFSKVQDEIIEKLDYSKSDMLYKNLLKMVDCVEANP